MNNINLYSQKELFIVINILSLDFFLLSYLHWCHEETLDSFKQYEFGLFRGQPSYAHGRRAVLELTVYYATHMSSTFSTTATVTMHAIPCV